MVDEAIAECRPDFVMRSTECFTQRKDLPDIQWRKRGETGGGGIMKNEMPSLLLDEKICFIRLPPDTWQNFWQVIT
jgi:hypothetical protein